MSRTDDIVVILVTAPDAESGRRVARDLLDRRLVACANLVPGIRSMFWWKEALEESEEVLVLLKARGSDVGAIAARVEEVHPYEVPEVLALPVTRGLEAYVNWVHDETDRDAG